MSLLKSLLKIKFLFKIKSPVSYLLTGLFYESDFKWAY